MGRIPKAKKTSSDIIPEPKVGEFHPSEGTIKFSFEALERTEYFNLDMTCPRWPSDLIEMLKEVSKHKVNELISGRFRKYRVHNHENANPPSDLPQGVELKDFYQIRLSTAKGGIHGVFCENVFYVMWLDPLHNMYPDERFGGLRRIKPPSNCCMERDEEILKLQADLDKAKQEAKDWEKIAEEYTDPEKRQES